MSNDSQQRKSTAKSQARERLEVFGDGQIAVISDHKAVQMSVVHDDAGTAVESIDIDASIRQSLKTNGPANLAFDIQTGKLLKKTDFDKLKADREKKKTKPPIS